MRSFFHFTLRIFKKKKNFYVFFEKKNFFYVFFLKNPKNCENFMLSDKARLRKKSGKNIY